jgi:acyl dehydratase
MGARGERRVSPDQSHLAGLTGRELGERVARYDEREAILYALAVGARETQLDLVYERGLRVLPTFAVTLGLWAVEEAGEAGRYDRTNTLHVGQQLTVHGPLPVSGEIVTCASIESVWDKGSAALLVVRVSADLFDARYTIFLPGLGGFGGERGTSERFEVPDRDPDFSTTIETVANQAALYRLTGDLHPLHVDPDIAAAAGFERPILHGLATLGAAALALSEGAGRPAAELAEISVRFGAPVLPGDHIDLTGWSEGDGVLFTAGVGGTEVLKAGSARFSG